MPEALKGTFVDETAHFHKALLQFLNAGVVGPHATEADLREILEDWPGYAKARGIDINGAAKDFERLWITKQSTIAAASGPGGNFEIATIKRS